MIHETLLNNKTFGILTIKLVLLFYDQPRLFVAESNIDNQLYLINCVDEYLSNGEITEVYCAVAVSQHIVNQIDYNLNLRNVFKYPDDGLVYLITINEKHNLFQVSTINSADLEDKYLPSDESFLT